MVNQNLVILLEGCPADKIELFRNKVTTLEYKNKGDEIIVDGGMENVGSKEYKYKLREPYDTVGIDGSPCKVSMYF